MSQDHNLIVNMTFNPPFITIVGPIKENTVLTLNTLLPQVTTTTSTATAIYVWLSTLEQGRFSDNAFVLLPGATKTVKFLSFDETGISAVALEASLRVEHLGMYL